MTDNASDNGYVCFYKGKRFECHAATTVAAQEIAMKHFRVKKAWHITVVLAEKNGEQVTHSTGSL